jgi:hypothetical protein
MALVSSLTAPAQLSPKQYLVRMNEKYLKVNSLSMQVELLYFTGSNDVTPVQRAKGAMVKRGTSFYSRLMGKTTIKSKGVTLYIDEGEQLILYGEYDQNQKTEGMMDVPDTNAFGQDAHLSMGKATANCERIVIVPQDQLVYKQVQLLINRTSFALEEIIYHYKVPADEDPAQAVQIVKVNYSQIQFNPPIAQHTFSTAPYVTRKKGKLVGVGIYSSYQVFEQPIYELPQ